MLSCKQLVLRSSDFLDGQLTLRERFALRTHLAMCINCRRFIRQLRLTQQVVQQLPEVEISGLDALAERLARAAKKPEKRS